MKKVAVERMCRRCGLPQRISAEHVLACTWHPSQRMTPRKAVKTFVDEWLATRRKVGTTDDEGTP